MKCGVGKTRTNLSLTLLTKKKTIVPGFFSEKNIILMEG